MEKMTRVVGELSYNPKDIIGKGGFSTVFSGLYSSRAVAIKRVLRSYNKKESAAQLREVELMKTANGHRNILCIIHTEINDDFLFIATELCRGTLQDYVKGKYDGPKFESEKEILLQITQGLAHLHKEKIVHRDINPYNILIFVPDRTRTDEPVMKLGGFGISKMLEVGNNYFLNTNPVNPIGTSGWMPPEVYKEDRFDFKVDVWALGCIFAYTLCGGKHPFGEDVVTRVDLIRGENPMLMDKKDMKGSYKRDHQAFAVIKSMLRTSPSKRPTVEDVLKHPFFIFDDDRIPYFEQLWSSFKDSVTSDQKVQLEKMLREIDLDEKMESDNTPLHILCQFYKNDNLINLIKLLIEKGTDVNAENEEGEMPLHLLCSNYERDNIKDIVKLLIYNGADVTAKINHRNPLHYFCNNAFESNQNFNRKDIFQFLVESGADVNAKNKDGSTPLHLLFTTNGKDNDQEDIAQLLIERHFNVNTSLHFLFSRFKTEKEIGELRYNPKAIIGLGAFGTVYSGFYSAKSMPVAVKQIQLGRVKAEDVKIEVELMIKAKDHPNVLCYISLERDGDFMFIATELCRGTLKQYITGERYTEQRFLSEREVLFQITRGLAHLHGLNIVHRDIKPTNILIYVPPSSDAVESHPQIKLADFGRSKYINEDFTNTNRTDPNGTRGWIAPELYRDQRARPKVDIFALGLIFGYTLSEGKHPFGDHDLDDRVMRIKKNEPMKMVRNDLKEPFSSENDEAFDLIKFMLEANPDKRPTVQNIVTSPFFSANRQKLFESISNSFRKCITADSIAKFEKLLKDDLIDVNAQLESGYTPLHISCQYCGISNMNDVVRFLVTEKGADVNARDKYEETPLHILCQNNENENLIDIAQFLIQNEADINAKNKDGWTPLISLCYHYKNDNLIEIVQLFIQKGEVNTKDTDGFTPLHWLCRNYKNDNLIDIVQLLVENSVKVNEKNNKYGRTPLHHLCNYYKIDNATKEEDNLKNLISFFENHGASMDEKDNEGMTPNDYLIRRKENPDGTHESTDRSQ